MTTVLVIGAASSAGAVNLPGLSIVTAPTIEAWLASSRQGHVDVVVYFPGTAGPETLASFGSEAGLSGVPLLVVLDQLSVEAIRAWMDAGADDCLAAADAPSRLPGVIRTRLAKETALEARLVRAMDTLRYTITTAMPHEFRTALVGILGFSSMLREDAASLKPAEIRDMAGYIEKSATRMHRQVESYAWYARLKTQEITGLQTTPSRDHICDTPAELIESLAYQHAEKANRVGDLLVELDDAPVNMFEEYVQKILDEVLDNAFKFSNPGTPIVVSVDINGSYSIRIRDHGRGMTDDQIEQIGAYMQFDRNVYEQQGAGMGLTIARGLAQVHGGKIVIKSKPGEGTEVCVALPLVRGEKS